MKLRNLSALVSTLIVAFASILGLVFVGQAQAATTTLYWCQFGANGNWSTAADWYTNSSCSSGGSNEAPTSVGGPYNLVFVNTAMNSPIAATDDVSGLSVNNITFSGSGSGGYILGTSGGASISLSGGITDTISNSSADESVSMNLNLTGSQSFDNSQGSDHLSINGTVGLGSSNLTLATEASEMTINNAISGSGTLTLSSPPGGSNTANYLFNNADSGFSGPVVISSGAVGEDNSNSFNAFGSGLITVNNGGSLLINSTASTGTLANNLALAGSGIPSAGLYAITSCLDDGGSSPCTQANTTLTLSGNVTLNANTTLVNGAYTVGEGSPPTNNATFNFTADGVYNGHSLAALANSNTTVNGPTSVASFSGGSGSSTNAKAPNTGQGLLSVDKYAPLIAAVLVAGALVITSIALSKRLNNSGLKKR